MGLRVAIDLDGTVADLSRALHDIARDRYRKTHHSTLDLHELTNTPPAAVDGGYESGELRRLWNHALQVENFWASLPEMQTGLIRRIQRLADEYRWEILFITTRPLSKGRPTQEQSQQWLSSHGFRLPSVYVVKGSRGKIADALQLDAVIDDRPGNAMDVALESEAVPILVWPQPLEQLSPPVQKHGVVVVESIVEALDHLVSLDRRRRGGVSRKIRRIFSWH